MRAMNVDKLNLRELTALQQKLSIAIATARSREITHVRQKVAEFASEHGFSVTELFGGRTSKGKRISTVKYADPNDAMATWKGRGRKPNWLIARLKKGAKLSDFEI